jgi:hypothetical protein
MQTSHPSKTSERGTLMTPVSSSANDKIGAAPGAVGARYHGAPLRSRSFAAGRERAAGCLLADEPVQRRAVESAFASHEIFRNRE